MNLSTVMLVDIDLNKMINFIEETLKKYQITTKLVRGNLNAFSLGNLDDLTETFCKRL